MPLSFTSEQKQTGLWLTVGIALVALLVLLGPVLTPFIAAGIIAYALNPVVDRLASKRIGALMLPRSVAVTSVLLLLFTAILALVLIVVPVLEKEILLLQEKIPYLLGKLNATLGPRLRQFGIDINLDLAGIGQLASAQLSASSDTAWAAVLSSAKVGGLAVLGWIGTFILIPVVLFYLLLDWHTLVNLLANAVPRRWIKQTVALAREVDGLLAQYLRGQLAVMLALALYYSVALAIAGLDVALPVGILTGLLVFIPYLGYGLGLFLALIAALLQFGNLYGLTVIAVIYGIGQVVESFFLTPRMVGERIGLHPLAVIFALLAFGQLFGFVGVLLALPASAIVSVAFRHMRAHYLQSSFYNQS
ncbi:MAG TPA: AI-2E family transporter [Burkholderiaceae bacterium]|jgi:predicted PurR-regulated permease PerM|nr:AI-2E family transporter [Burkholderiaceae bacterium]